LSTEEKALLNFIESYLDNSTLMTEFLNETYQGLSTYDEARILKKMLLSKNIDSANEFETAYEMYGRTCTPGVNFTNIVEQLLRLHQKVQILN
jgi:hypothetical protein